MSISSKPRSKSNRAQPPTRKAARERIVAAARLHFFAHGFRNVSMDDLAAELGMSKKTLYLHFKTKETLLVAVIRNKFDELEQQFDTIVGASANDMVRGLHELLECMQRQIAEIQPAFVRDIRRETPHIFDLIVRRRAVTFERCFGALLSQGRKSGLIRKDVPVKTAIEILLGATNAVMNPTKLAELGLTPTSAYSAIMSIFLEGIVTDKGRRTV